MNVNLINTFRQACGAVFFVLWAFPAMAAPNALQGAAPDFKLSNLQGKVKTLNDYRGHVILLNFWASWCPPCIEEMPLLQELHTQYKDMKFTVIGINVDEDPDSAREALKNLKYKDGKPVKVTFPILLDSDNKITERYKVGAMPSTFVIDNKGNWRFLHKGYKPGYIEKYRKDVKKLIREKS
ncbi:MAG: TlpA disulfide reductase family protein [Pseudomonadota bacterium]